MIVSNSDDLKKVASDYGPGELTSEGRFYFPLTSLTRLDSAAFSVAGLKIFDDTLANITYTQHLFSSSKLEKINIENRGANGTLIAVPGIQMSPVGKSDYKVKFYNATGIQSTFQQTYIRKNSDIRVYAPKASKMSGLFEAYGRGGFEVMSSSPNINIEVDCRNVTNADRFGYYNSSIDELDFPVDEDGNHTFGSGKPEVGRLYTTFPKLKSGKLMFNSARLTKNYALAILNDLPDWSNDTTSHEIALGIHIDHKYDPEVNIALKKCQNSYVTPIEEYGASLPEEVPTDKGWTLTIQWNGTATENAYPAPSA